MNKDIKKFLNNEDIEFYNSLDKNQKILWESGIYKGRNIELQRNINSMKKWKIKVISHNEKRKSKQAED